MMIVPGSKTDSFSSLCGSTIVPFRNTSSCRGAQPRVRRVAVAEPLQVFTPKEDIVPGQTMHWIINCITIAQFALMSVKMWQCGRVERYLDMHILSDDRLVVYSGPLAHRGAPSDDAVADASKVFHLRPPYDPSKHPSCILQMMILHPL